MVFNLLRETSLLSLYKARYIFEAERLAAELTSKEYTVPQSETIYDLLIAVSAVVMAVLLIFRLALSLAKLISELKYVNSEIRRTRGSERKAWQKKKRRLWLSLIPFYKR